MNTAPIPLFEKLFDENTDEQFEKTPKRFSSFRDLQKSILQDLSYLLNTRAPPLWQESPLSYGVTVTAPTSAENVFEIQELESRIDYVIKKFESRLTNAKSHITGIGSDPSRIFVSIDAAVTLENRKMPLSFPLVIEN
ncbi:MAG: type VI secretion system baseplate subunit TssE [Holosporaceae bacterium]|jgi:type VI secretion system lysozyme-like protein|nr:type VI secretion system baseplate subunit TssE [Holosporaceae bacterium]